MPLTKAQLQDFRQLNILLCASDYLRKIIVQGRSSKSTKVGDIMTEEVCHIYSYPIDKFVVGLVHNKTRLKGVATHKSVEVPS